MRPAVLRSLLATTFLVAAIAVPMWSGSAAQAEDATYLADVISARDVEPPLSGPIAGSLVQQEAFASVEPAGVAVADFTARVVFQNPDDASRPWDFGFDFGHDGNASQRLMVDSTGVWRYSPFPDGASDSGPAPGLDREPGSLNTLDLVVEGEFGILGVNGAYVTTVALPPAVTSDVFVITGVYSSTTIEAREIDFSDFTVWALPDPDAAAQPTSTLTSEVISLDETPEPGQTPALTESEPPSEEDLAVFDLLIEAQATIPLEAGPFNANLKEEAGPVTVSWANVNLADFHATATFAAPNTESPAPWDIGFMFRTSENGTLRVAVAEDGRWYASSGEDAPSSTGTLNGLNTEPGALNTLDLMVSGDRAVLGVNGAYGAAIDLPVGGAAGDVAAGAGFFIDHQEADRVTEFQEFVVRPLDLEALEAAPQQVATTVSADARGQFAGYLAGTAGIAPLVGPLAGELVESGTGTVSLAASGVSLSDFAAIATFVNPENLTVLWDGGIQFRTDTQSTNRIVLRSNGEIQVVQGDGSVAIVGLASNYDATPGGVNTLQVFVVGDQALVGVNDTLVASVTLVTPPVTGDVQVGAGFFGEDQLAGRVTPYDGFSVWSIA